MSAPCVYWNSLPPLLHFVFCSLYFYPAFISNPLSSLDPFTYLPCCFLSVQYLPFCLCWPFCLCLPAFYVRPFALSYIGLSASRMCLPTSLVHFSVWYVCSGLPSPTCYAYLTAVLVSLVYVCVPASHLKLIFLRFNLSPSCLNFLPPI